MTEMDPVGTVCRLSGEMLDALPLPDLPSIPWPSIPWPDLPNVQVPEWVRWVANHLKYVWPVILAFVLAEGEIRRRRKHAAAAETAEVAAETAEMGDETRLSSPTTTDSAATTEDSTAKGADSAGVGQRRGL
jgi:flagellar biosynthesis/type III secretory pathway M-ring protein FliF/YscJ